MFIMFMFSFFYCSIRSVILFEVCCCCFLSFSQTLVSKGNNFPLKQISEKCERGMTGMSPELSLTQMSPKKVIARDWGRSSFLVVQFNWWMTPSIE